MILMLLLHALQAVASPWLLRRYKPYAQLCKIPNCSGRFMLRFVCHLVLHYKAFACLCQSSSPVKETSFGNRFVSSGCIIRLPRKYVWTAMHNFRVSKKLKVIDRLQSWTPRQTQWIPMPWQVEGDQEESLLGFHHYVVFQARQ